MSASPAANEGVVRGQDWTKSDIADTVAFRSFLAR